VEDDVRLSTRLRDDLGRKGYAVDVADNGVDAQHYGAEEPYDAVILDLGLPRRSGLEVLRNWRAQGNAVPVLILTARDAWHEKVEGFNAGELAQDADELFNSLVVLPSGEASLALAHFDPSFLSPSSGRYCQIMIDRGIALRSPSLVYQSLPMGPVDRGRRAVAEVAGPDQQSLLLSASGYEFKGRPITIAVAADLKPIDTALAKFLLRYTQLSLVMSACLVVLQVVIVRLALAPLRRVHSDVGRLEHGEIRQLGEAVPVEVLPLVREVNRLLALLAQRLHRSRQALGNLAHALKAPLTVLTHMATDEHIQSHPPPGSANDGAARTPARSHRQRAQASPRRRRARARVGTRSFGGDRVLVGDLAQTVPGPQSGHRLPYRPEGPVSWRPRGLARVVWQPA